MRKQLYKGKIQGMICRQCEDTVCMALTSQRGVMKANASFIKNEVEIEYDADLISEEGFGSCLESIGYPIGSKKITTYLIELLILVGMLILFYFIMNLKCVEIPRLKSGGSLGAVFLTGILTGAHCISMCGGIELIQASGGLTISCDDTRKRSLKALIEYNLGRLITATILGAIFGLTGQVIVYNLQIKSMVFTMVGLFMIVIGIRMWGIIPRLRNLEAFLPSFCRLPKTAKRFSVGKPLIVGLMTGIMPCGASYAMWLFSATSGSMFRGALTMFVWALGTIPLLFTFGWLGTSIPRKYSKWMIVGNVFLIIAFGTVMMIKGLRMY